MCEMKEKVRWILSFHHSEGGGRNDPNFPRVEFWQPNKFTSLQEAARVLAELREERGDERDWIAAGHPDPFVVAKGRHIFGQWILRYDDLVPNSGGKIKSFAGAWEGIVDGEEMKLVLDEARHPDRARYPIE